MGFLETVTPTMGTQCGKTRDWLTAFKDVTSRLPSMLSFSPFGWLGGESRAVETTQQIPAQEARIAQPTEQLQPTQLTNTSRWFSAWGGNNATQSAAANETEQAVPAQQVTTRWWPLWRGAIDTSVTEKAKEAVDVPTQATEVETKNAPIKAAIVDESSITETQETPSTTEISSSASEEAKVPLFKDNRSIWNPTRLLYYSEGINPDHDLGKHHPYGEQKLTRFATELFKFDENATKDDKAAYKLSKSYTILTRWSDSDDSGKKKSLSRVERTRLFERYILPNMTENNKSFIWSHLREEAECFVDQWESDAKSGKPLSRLSPEMDRRRLETELAVLRSRLANMGKNSQGEGDISESTVDFASTFPTQISPAVPRAK